MKRELSVTVVIPAFNAEAFIEEAVRSCLNQSHRPIEVMVVDDGSSDGTAGIVTRLADASSKPGTRVVLHSMGINRGVGHAVHEGFARAGGDYVCWLSADDAFAGRLKAERQVARMESKGADWSYYSGFYRGPSLFSATPSRGSYLPRLPILDRFFVRDAELRLMALLFRNPINGSSVMIRRECIQEHGQFDPVANVDADGDLWMRYSALGLKLEALGGPGVFYREHSMQASKRKPSILYGSELTRMRMLIAQERAGRLTRLIKKSEQVLLMTLSDEFYSGRPACAARPFTTEFLMEHIIEKKGRFSWLMDKMARRTLDFARRHASYSSVDMEKFRRDLSTLQKSQEFEGFQLALNRMG